jgi:hypothetical protein
MSTLQCRRCKARFESDESKRRYCSKCHVILFERWARGALIGFVLLILLLWLTR